MVGKKVGLLEGVIELTRDDGAPKCPNWIAAFELEVDVSNPIPDQDIETESLFVKSDGQKAAPLLLGFLF